MGRVGSTLTPEAKMAGFPLSSMSSSSSLVVVRPAASRGHNESMSAAQPREFSSGLALHLSLGPTPQLNPSPLSLLISSCLCIRPLQRSL